MSIQSFVLEDPERSVYHAPNPAATRILLSLTPYDLRVLALVIAQGVHPQQHDDPEVQRNAATAGRVVLDHLGAIWDALTAAEQISGLKHEMGPNDTE